MGALSLGVIHDPTVKPEKRTRGVFLDGVLRFRTSRSGAKQYAKGMRAGLGEPRSRRVEVHPITPETPMETWQRMHGTDTSGPQNYREAKS